MQYQAHVQDFSYEWYEGTLYLEIDNNPFAVTFVVDSDEFVDRHLKIGANLTVDLWMRYCTKIEFLPSNAPKYFPMDRKIAGGDIQGQVISVFGTDAFRVDCGIMTIDVNNETGIIPLVGQMIKTRGTYHVFFPNTECSCEELGLM